MCPPRVARLGPYGGLHGLTGRLCFVTSYLDDFSPGSGRRSRPRAWLATDAPMLSLNGDWKFRWSPVAYGLDDAAADPDFDDAAGTPFRCRRTGCFLARPRRLQKARTGGRSIPIFVIRSRSIHRMFPMRTRQVIIAVASSSGLDG
jgi:hypothetical protein